MYLTLGGDVDTRLSLFLRELAITPLFVHSSMLNVIEDLIHTKLEGGDIRLGQGANIYDEDTKAKYTVLDNGKGIVTAHGVMLQKSMGMEGVSGLMTTVNLMGTMYAMLDDPKVSEILLDVNTPGGSGLGIREVCDLIAEVNAIKPVDVFVNGMMASAGVWAFSSARRIYAYTDSHIGSIGGYTMHVDQSGADAANGLKVTCIKVGDYKALGNPHEPLSSGDTAEIQASLNKTVGYFIADVAKYRNIDPQVLRDTQARMYNAEEALELGLIDEIRNFAGVIEPSYIYSFLTKSKENPVFNSSLKDQLKAFSKEDLKENAPELYTDVYDAGKFSSEAETAALTAKVAELTEFKSGVEAKEALSVEQTKIISFATSFGVKDYGQELVDEGKSLTEAYELIAVKTQETQNSAKAAFVKSAPDFAGHSEDGTELDGSEPKDAAQAMAYCMQKYSCTKGTAWKHARADFPNFFGQNVKENN